MNEQNTIPTPSPFTGMSELWQLAWALQGVTRTLDIEHGDADDSPFERDRLHGLASAAHLLSSHMLRFADCFNEALYAKHDEALARIAEPGESPVDAAARLLRDTLDADIARHEAEQAAEQARSERIEAARVKAKEQIYAALDEMEAAKAAA